jgi:hypothetical protein
MQHEPAAKRRPPCIFNNLRRTCHTTNLPYEPSPKNGQKGRSANPKKIAKLQNEPNPKNEHLPQPFSFASPQTATPRGSHVFSTTYFQRATNYEPRTTNYDLP